MSSRGMSMAEITVAAGILILAAVPLLSTMTRSAAVTEGTLETLAQLTAAESVVEYVLASPWDEIPEGEFDFTLPSPSSRPAAADGGAVSGFGSNIGSFVDSPAPVSIHLKVRGLDRDLKSLFVESTLLQEAQKGAGRRRIVLETAMGRWEARGQGEQQ